MTSTPQRRRVDPEDVFDSRRYGFSQAVAVTGGTTVYVSGQVGWNSNELPDGSDLATQTQTAFDNLERVMAAAGGTLADVDALRIYIVSEAAADLSPVSDQLLERFPHDGLPASTWLVVSGLAGEGLLIEIEATATLAT